MWTLVLVFVMNGVGSVSAVQVPGFTSMDFCVEQGKELQKSYPNHATIASGKAELALSWTCMKLGDKPK